MDQKQDNTAVVVKSPIDTVRDLLTRLKPQLMMALPKTLNADRLIRIAVTSCQKNPMLLECAPVTLMGAIMQCAQLGLVPDGVLGEAYLIPYRNNAKNRMEAQFQIGFKGLRKLVHNTGEIETFLPQVVYEGDSFECSMAEARIIKHDRTDATQYGKPTHFYTVVKWKSGNVESWIMPRAEVDHVRDSFSQAYRNATRSKRDDTPWIQHYEAMGMKTVMRKHGKYLPLSAEAQSALALDEKADAGLPQDLGQLIDPAEAPTQENGTAPNGKDAIQEPRKRSE